MLKVLVMERTKAVVHKFHWVTNAPLCEPGPVLSRRRRRGRIVCVALFRGRVPSKVAVPSRHAHTPRSTHHQRERERERDVMVEWIRTLTVRFLVYVTRH